MGWTINQGYRCRAGLRAAPTSSVLLKLLNRADVNDMIAILAVPGDAHVHACAWALEQISAPFRILYPKSVTKPGNCPGIRILCDDTSPNHALDDDESNVYQSRYSLIWNRRTPSEFYLPKISDPIDRYNYEETFLRYSKVSCELMCASNYTINSPERDAYASNKALQLKLALECGFSIPDTFIGPPEQVPSAFLSVAKHKLIYKPLRENVWKVSDECFSGAYATRVPENHDFENADSHSYSGMPGIFQLEVDKNAEARIIVMGQRVFGRLCKPVDHGHEVDWRTLNAQTGLFEVFDISPTLAQQCLDLTNRLGLIYAAIDLAIDQMGRYVFFEVNPKGQFLFCEAECPELKLLSEFTRMLVSRECASVMDRWERIDLRYADYSSEHKVDEYIGESGLEGNFYTDRYYSVRRPIWD